MRRSPATRPPPLAVPGGFLNVCKAPGFTSHDVVAVVRRIVGTRRVGHAGTLDPAAEGVLPICVGLATRLVDRLADRDKGYYAEIRLGVRTRTDDAEGEVIESTNVPSLDLDQLETALNAFRGPILQRPPAYSAIKVGGRRAYDLARRGADVELRPREVTVHGITPAWWRPPILALTIACSKGTYIRAIARDLGELLGCGAHLARLVRLWVGGFNLVDAVSLNELATAVAADGAGRCLQPPEMALHDLPAAIVDPKRRADMKHGRAWPLATPTLADYALLPSRHQADPVLTGAAAAPEALARVYATDGLFLGVAAADRRRGVWQPRLAWARDDDGV